MKNKYLFIIALNLGMVGLNYADDQRWIVYTATQGINCNGGFLTTNGADTFCSTTSASGFTVIGSPNVNDEVVWNGTAPQWTAEGVSYAFSIASFSDGLAAVIEEGVGVWKAIGAISFTASYNNGPATGGFVSFSGWANLTMGNSFQGPTVTVAATNFPAVGTANAFTLNATNGTISPTSTITHTFDNDRYWGLTSLSGSVYTSTDITSGLGNNELSNVIPKTFTVTAGAGQYIVYAYPARLGTATFTVGGFSGGFLPAVSVSVTNGSSYVENFSVYRSVNSNLGNTTVVVTTP